MTTSVRRVSGRKGHAPGRPCAEESAARIESLLDVAAEVFMDRGYEGASLDEIARRAGASKQTLYSRFPSKARLFQGVFERETEKTGLRFRAILRDELPMPKVLEELGLDVVASVVAPRSQRLIRTVGSTVEAFPELARGLWRQMDESGTLLLDEYIRGRVAAGELQAEDPRMAAHVFFGLILGPYYLPAQLGVKPGAPLKNRTAYVREAVRLFLACYGVQKPESGTTKKRKARKAK